MAVERFIATNNITKLMSDDSSVCVPIDATLATAHIEDVAASEHVSNMIDDLEKKAKEVTIENPESPEVKNDNIYTKKLTLDESLNEFSIEDNKNTRVYDDDAYDTYWDMDMFDFIYELVSISDTRRKPLDPLGRPHARFSVSGRDKYAGLTDEQKKLEKSIDAEESELGIGLQGSSQIGVGDDYIEVYAHNLFRFDDIRKICDIYKFNTEGPVNTYKTKRNKFMMTAAEEWLVYEYMFRIYVPCDKNGIPLRIDDYFETLDLTIEDVMNPEFVKNYRKIESKIAKEQSDMLAKKEKEISKNAATKHNDTRVKEIFDDYVKKASWSDTDLNVFIRDMFTDMSSEKLKFSRNELKQKFLDEFTDDFEESDSE